MRVTGLLALFFPCLTSFALVSVCAAPASDQASPTSVPPATFAPADSAKPKDAIAASQSLISADSFDKRYGILRNDSDSAPDWLDTPAQRYFSRMKQEEDGVCYKLRSYKVARDARASDSTHPVGYSTCQSASKFQMRSADEGVLPEKK
jgi:hypothetical protein